MLNSKSNISTIHAFHSQFILALPPGTLVRPPSPLVPQSTDLGVMSLRSHSQPSSNLPFLEHPLPRLPVLYCNPLGPALCWSSFNRASRTTLQLLYCSPPGGSCHCAVPEPSPITPTPVRVTPLTLNSKFMSDTYHSDLS